MEKLEFLLQNNDEPFQSPVGKHPSASIGSCLNSDIYRLSVEVEGSGYEALILSELVSVRSGQSVNVPEYVTRSGKISGRVAVRLTAISESDPEVRHTMIKLLEI